MPTAVARRQGREAKIDLTQALPWLIINRDAPESSQRDRLARAQAIKFEISNQITLGKLVYVHQVAEVLNELAADLAARHNALPGRVANEFAGITDAAIIRGRLVDEMRAIRAGFADATDKLADKLGRAADPDDDAEVIAAEPEKPVKGSKARASKPPRSKRKRTPRAQPAAIT